MAQSGKTASRPCLEWLEFEQERCNRLYPGHKIKHAYNFGEQKVAGYSVDGLLCIPNQDDGSVYTVAYEFLGCYWHFCPWKCTKTKLTIEDARKDEQRHWKIMQEVDVLITKRGCEWEEERKVWLDKFQSSNFAFIHEKAITEEKILAWVKDGKFYGMIRADVNTPPDVVEELKHLNFPFVFGKFRVTEEMLSESMRRLARENGKKFPMVTRTLTWNAENVILTTPLVNFYTEIGMKITNIRWAIQYVPSKPFTNFVDGMVDVRIQAKRTGNNPLGERAKFCLNSCVGRFG